jgi:hypothetical protein
MLDPEFKRIDLSEIPGGLAAAGDKLPNAPGVYAFFRRIPALPVSDKETFRETLLSTVGEHAAPDHDASIGPLHSMSLYSFSKLTETREAQLDTWLESDEFRRVVSKVFTKLPALQGPLYVGKARKLQNRIKQHFKPLSPLRKRLRQVGIPLDRCVLVYCLLDENMDTLTDEALVLIEDIITRVLRPGFVLRIG